MLPCQSGNPKIVLRNGLTGHAELMPDVGVDTTGFCSNGENNGTGFEFIKANVREQREDGMISPHSDIHLRR